MDDDLLGVRVANIRDTEAGDDEAGVVARAEPPEPVYDPARHRSGIVPELQCVPA